MFYECLEHKVGYQQFNQFHGHWLNSHRGTEQPKPEEVAVETLSEGVELKAPPQRKQSPPDNPPANEGPEPSEGRPDEVPDEAAARLDRLLVGIGASEAARKTIGVGFRNFEMLRYHPANLSNFITPILDPKIRSLIPMVVHEMFPPPPGEEMDPPYIYADYRPGPRYPRGAPYWEHPSAYGPRNSWRPEPYSPPYYHGPSREEGSQDPDPAVKALQDTVKGLMEELKEQRAIAEQERRDRQEQEKQAQVDTRFELVERGIDALAKDISGLTGLIREENAKVRASTEASATEKLQTEVASLRSALSDEKDERLLGAIGELRADKVKLESAISELRTNVAAGQTGRTTEDLLSEGIPLAFKQVESLTDAVKGELSGIREAITEGKGPAITFPKRAAADGHGVVEQAENIVAVRTQEDRILKLARERA